MFKVGSVVRLIQDPRYNTKEETDHCRITEINSDGTFHGIGITTGCRFSFCSQDKWEETYEG